MLLRDQPAIVDLVQSVLGQLVHARGGAEPLLATLDAYFATGGVTTETARRLHLSVRAVTYRLDRIKTLTGYDPTDPAQRFTIHTAVLGAKLLGWPKQPTPDRSLIQNRCVSPYAGIDDTKTPSVAELRRIAPARHAEGRASPASCTGRRPV